MNILTYKILKPNLYEFNIQCNQCNSIYTLTGSKKVIKHKIDTKCHGCPCCSKTMTLQKFLFNINKNNLYEKFEYPNIENEYVDANTEITIICKIHGKFKCTPVKHLKTVNCGCPKCTKNLSISKNEWLNTVNSLNDNKYKYPNLDKEYHNLNSLITIECPIHGKFIQNAGLHYRGCGCKRCNGRGIKFDKNDKLNLLTKHDLLSMSWSVILDLIGEDKIPKEFNQLCKFGENTPERKKMIEDLINTYNIKVDNDEENLVDKAEENLIDNEKTLNTDLETKVNNIDNEIYDDLNNEYELKPYKEIKDLGEILDKEFNETLFSTGDKWIHIMSKEINKLWNNVLRDNENHNENTINEIQQKLTTNSLTKFEKYVYEEFMNEYTNVINLTIH